MGEKGKQANNPKYPYRWISVKRLKEIIKDLDDENVLCDTLSGFMMIWPTAEDVGTKNSIGSIFFPNEKYNNFADIKKNKKEDNKNESKRVSGKGS